MDNPAKLVELLLLSHYPLLFRYYRAKGLYACGTLQDTFPLLSAAAT